MTRGWRERWQSLDPLRADAVLIAILVVLLIPVVIASDRREGAVIANLLVGFVVIGSLVLRRERPLLTAALAAGGTLAMELFLTVPLEYPSLTFALMIAAYSVGVHAEGRRALVGLALAAGTILTIGFMETPDDILFPFFIFGVAPWAVGRMLRSHTQLARELAEQEARVRHLREQEEAAAIARERTRVARELHDVLAHNLSVMVIQASGARRALARDPEVAIEAAALIERTGREALVELRQIFGPLHRGEGEALEGAVGLAQVPRLVERARAAGLDATLEFEGEPMTLTPGADAAAYRVIQEALTNTLKHAGGAPARVHVRFRPDGVTIAVTDDGRSGGRLRVEGAGHGLIGMRERIELYDGEFEAGPRTSGGYEVRARLPVDAVGAGAP
ncbi:MAG TPA: histidine kinase [Solirubrobacterales bacterium]|nr:histidine kinase [Solirubrobacterales bacterium]